MTGFILGQKLEQSQTFNQKGKRIPTTYIKTSPCFLIDIKKPNKNQYFAITLAFGQVKNIKKTVDGILKKAGVKTPLRFLREFRLEKAKNKINLISENKREGILIGETKIFIGDEIKPGLFFKKSDFINISGKVKGKGFQGVVKRHHFAGGPRTHGQSDRERAPGSIGQTTTPGRVYKGKRMAGRMGGQKVTIKNLEIIDLKDDGILVKGLLPGPKNNLLEIKSYS